MLRPAIQRGFTLIEMVVTIVIMSILSIGLVTYITNSASSYTETAARNQVSASGRAVIDRIAMELHNALPASVRISSPLNAIDEGNNEGFSGDQCLEFIPVRSATTYIDPAFRPAAHKASFSVVDFVPVQSGQNGVYAVVYPTASSQLYGIAFGPADATETIARVNVANGAGATDTVTYSRASDNLSYNHRFTRQSSADRIFLTDAPVSFCITGNKLYRYSDYGFPSVQMRPLEPGGLSCTAGPPLSNCLPGSTPNRVLISDQIANGGLTGGVAGQAFDQLVTSRQRNAVIQLELKFNQDGQEVTLNHEVLLQMTP